MASETSTPSCVARGLWIVALFVGCGGSDGDGPATGAVAETSSTAATTQSADTSTAAGDDGSSGALPGSTSTGAAGSEGSTSSETGAPEACAGEMHTPGGPDRWGGCWPGLDNTGVPAGVELTDYEGPCTITEDGTIIDAQRVECDLSIQAADVMISRSLVIGSVATDEDSTGFSFTIVDSEVDVGDRPGTGVGAVSFTATRVHVRGGNRSMHCWHDCTIEDSYVHGQYEDETGTSHESGIRMGDSATIRHNSIICDAPNVPPDGGCSADLTGYGDFAPVENNTIDRNLFGASTGGYCSYGGSTAGKPYSDDANNVVFTGNVWQRGETQSDHGEYVCGYYGSNTGFDADAPGNVWDDNVFDDDTPVEAAN